ncbi:hypothetical protein BpHYR1_040898 [Brachionus plicatilis]|uniref:Uncharacterized protein n=1 Tax=Brachionus plicatilis TaxID=10195 RepID=A0A3M7RSM7_BRAPC|nr:hypothetical protein BpHYR1_040898 [Brachionus plicatilis]
MLFKYVLFAFNMLYMFRANIRNERILPIQSETPSVHYILKNKKNKKCSFPSLILWIIDFFVINEDSFELKTTTLFEFIFFLLCRFDKSISVTFFFTNFYFDHSQFLFNTKPITYRTII